MRDTIQAILYHIPFIRWFVRDALEGAPDAVYFFYANVIMLAILGNYLFGLESLAVVGPLTGIAVFVAFARADREG